MESSSVPLSSWGTSLAAVVACSLFGALFAAADAAVTSIPEARVRAMVGTSEHGHAALRRFLEHRNAVLARLLVGRVVCAVGAAVIAATAFHPRWPVYGPLVTFFVVAFLYTVLAEISTSIGRTRATSLANPLLQIVRPLELAMVPLAAPLAYLGRRVSDAFDRDGRPSDPEETARDAEIAEREVEYLIEEGQRKGTLDHADLLQAAVDFKGRVAAEVMVPRTKMTALDLKTPLPRVLAVITADGHSRYPVYDGRVDEIVGLLYVKDLFRVVREGTLETTTFDSLVRRPVLYVQEQQEVSTILRDMRQQRQHLAVVVDEHGGTTGIVTMEDILELLVGDIRDELDEEEQVQDLGGGRLLVDAALSVDALSDRLGVVIPETDGAVSIGGLVMEQLGKVPPTGTVVHVGPVDFVIRDADERRVRRIEVVSRPERAAE
ncbi:MAG: HlyC/CorC family transporter [Deltaproteobacteria bacterium]|nr:HlyC/CorC family transporter [Deltaproteobacteria bacterium]